MLAVIPEPVVTASKPKLKKPPSNAIQSETPVFRNNAAEEEGNPAQTVDDDEYGDDGFDDYSDDAFEPYETLSNNNKPTSSTSSKTLVINDTISGVKRLSRGDSGSEVGKGALQEIQQAMKEENDAAMNRRREKLANDRVDAKEAEADRKEPERSVPAPQEKKQAKRWVCAHKKLIFANYTQIYIYVHFFFCGA
jgi:hypothetical protein